MKIAAVLLARSIALFDVADLTPANGIFFPRLISVLRERFNFTKYPEKIEDLDENKGISLEDGVIDGHAVANLTIYNDGIKIDLNSSTEIGQKIILDTLQWLAESGHIRFSNEMVKRWGFVSHLTFYSELDLDLIHPAFRILGQQLSSLVNSRTGLDLNFRTSAVHLNFDKTNRDVPIAPFQIERRAKTPFAENKYFSAAPLETKEHRQLLIDLEENFKTIGNR